MQSRSQGQVGASVFVLVFVFVFVFVYMYSSTVLRSGVTGRVVSINTRMHFDTFACLYINVLSNIGLQIW